MGIATGIFTFLIIWWLVLFAVLPFGVQSQSEADDIVPGTEPAAPVHHRMPIKLAVTTGVTAVLWIVVYFVISLDLIALRPPPV